MNTKLVLRPEQRLIMTPMLQHALKVLQLPTLELSSLIREELAENPMLEEKEGNERPEVEAEAPVPPEGNADRTTEVAVDEQGLGPSGFDGEEWDRYFADDEYEVPKYDHETTAEFTETQVTRPPSLEEHLLWQLRLVCEQEEDFRLGEQIIGNLDDRGFLSVPLSEIAQQAGVDEERVAEVLAVVQGLEPAGVGARDVIESLLLQLRTLPERNPLAEAIVEKHFSLLEKRQVDRIARAEKASHQAVLDAIQVISNLDPFPGRHQFTGAVETVVPDVVLEIHDDDEFVILINDDSLPELRISRANRQLLRQRKEMNAETKQYLEDKLQRAIWLIRSIEQRRKTLYRVVETIVDVQRDFFLKGVAHLKPLTLREIAERVGLHESTVSRVTSKKYIQTPRGVFELKYFFSSQIKTMDGGHTSSTSVKAALEELIAQEDAQHPLSDQRLTELLAQRGFDVARRTVAKYREELRLLPASRRRQLH